MPAAHDGAWPPLAWNPRTVAAQAAGDANCEPPERVPPYAVRLLDGFRWQQGERPLPALPRGRVGTLLKLLILNRRRPLPRGKLCALFWPQADSDAARNNLNVTLHRLRRALGAHGRLLRCVDDGWQLVFDADVQVDTEAFAGHVEAGVRAELDGVPDLAIACFEAGLHLYQADIAETEEDEEALRREHLALRDRRALALQRLAVLYGDADDWHACLRVGRQQLDMDPCNEQAHRLVMRCYVRLGQLQEAERQYRLCVRQLRQALAVNPSAETTALVRQMLMREAA
jgi:DNA-binding SARP family transcriptional activator